jgi:hypothetical protein
LRRPSARIGWWARWQPNWAGEGHSKKKKLQQVKRKMLKAMGEAKPVPLFVGGERQGATA